MTRSADVLVVRTGTANVASVLAALRRAGASAALTADRAAVRDAARVVLPGVGTFGAAMAELEAHALCDALRERIGHGRPTLAVCVGLQLLCASSEESPGVRGLGIVEDAVERLRGAVRVPQLGWNEVHPDQRSELVTAGYAYFANSFRLARAPSGWHAARARYGEEFIAAIERGPVLACQFHPELSGHYGLSLVQRWLEHSGNALATRGVAP